MHHKCHNFSITYTNGNVSWHTNVYRLPQVRNSEDLQLVTKVTNSTPHFVASSLDPGTAYTLHVAVLSPMGASTPIKLQAFTVKTAEKRMGKLALLQI